MYNNYYFYMEWEDIPEDFRNEKIDTWIRKEWEDGEFIDEDDNGNEVARFKDVQEAIDDPLNREDAEYRISARFPIYF